MEIQFKFSRIYERTLQLYKPKVKAFSIDDIKERRKEIDNDISYLNAFWKKEKTGIVKALKNVTKLSFKTDLICYLNSEISLSDPLSIKIENVTDMKNSLVHELIHSLLDQNNIGKTKGWEKLKEDFKKEKPLTQSHILIHAIHEEFCLKYNPSLLNRVFSYSKHPAYRRAWKIVRKLGAKNVINNYLIIQK